MALILSLYGLGTSTLSLAGVVLDNCLALQYLLIEQGRVCVITNTSCCTWINVTEHVKVTIKEMYVQADFAS